MKNKLGISLFTLVTFVLLVACTDSTNSESNGENVNGATEEFTIRLSHLIQTDNAGHIASESFKEEVEEESDGQITVEIYPNGELFDSDRETVEALQMDNVEMTIAGTTTLGDYDKNFYALDLPYVFEDKDDAREALNGELGEKLTENLSDLNIKSLGFGYDGVRHVTNNKQPIETLDDLSDLKLRTEESKIKSDSFKAFGANPSPLSFGEVYTALQQNTYDGIDSTTSLITTSNFHEVQDYLSLTGHAYAGAIIIISDNFYNELSEDLQEVVNTAGSNMEEEYYKLQDEAEAKALKEIEDDELMEVNEVSDSEKEEFKKASDSVYEKYQDEFDDEINELIQ